jgi:hypothetical protein
MKIKTQQNNNLWNTTKVGLTVKFIKKEQKSQISNLPLQIKEIAEEQTKYEGSRRKEIKIKDK